MTDDLQAIRLITILLIQDCRNGTVTIQPRTPCETRPPRQMTVDALEQVLLPLIDARAAKEALAEPAPPPV